MIEVADHENPGRAKLRKERFGVFYCRLRVHSFLIQDDVIFVHAKPEGHLSHGFGFVDRAVAGTTGKNQLSGDAVAVEAAGGADAVRQGLRGTAISISPRAE